MTDTSGTSHLGRIIAEADLGELAKSLGVTITTDGNVPTRLPRSSGVMRVSSCRAPT